MLPLLFLLPIGGTAIILFGILLTIGFLLLALSSLYFIPYVAVALDLYSSFSIGLIYALWFFTSLLWCLCTYLRWLPPLCFNW
jgi:hypothetical protein